MKICVMILLALFLSFPSHADDFMVSSRSFQAGKSIPDANIYSGFGCSGKNLSPELTWRNAPKGTKSFAVTVYDPDAPTGSGWWHWTLVNIPTSVSSLAEGASSLPSKLPEGAIEGRTDFGKPGYGGPCPPVGDKPHRYIVTIYALKVPRLEVGRDASGALVGFLLNQNLLAKTQLTATLGR